MKRFAALILALALCLSLIPAALADMHLSEGEMTQLTEYSYELALQYIGDREWEGRTRNLKQVSAKFWLPTEVENLELPQEAIDAGVLARYVSEMLAVQVRTVDYGELDLEDYLEIVTEQGFINPRIAPVNGVDFVIYDEPMDGVVLCRVAATVLPEGQFLEFIYYAVSEDVSEQIEGSIATIRFQ